MISKKNAWAPALIILIGSIAMAEGGEHHDAGIPWTTIFYQALNLAIVIGILAYFLREKLANHFSARHESFKKAVSQAQSTKEEAKKRYDDMAHRMEKLEKTTQESIEQARNEAERMKQATLTEARNLADHIRSEARRAAENELYKAKTHLKEEALELAIAAARSQLQSKVGGADHQRLHQEFIEKIQVIP